MKNYILNIACLVLVTIGTVSCNEKTKDNALNEVGEVAVATSNATAYTVDTSKSKILWKGEKPTGSHNGTIKIASGTVSAINNDIQAGNFTIDMKSIDSEDLEGKKKENLEAHLMGTVEGKEGDFFNVNTYPNSTFELTSVEDGDGQVTVKGNLTIKDKTNAIEFPATVSFSGDTMILKSNSFIIDRTKWDVNYGSKSIFDNLGDKFISDEIELVVELHASK